MRKNDPKFFTDPKAISVNTHYLRNLPVEEIAPYVKAELEKALSGRFDFYSAGVVLKTTLKEAGLDDNGYVGQVTQDMDCDIVYSNGSFVQYPEGVQTD